MEYAYFLLALCTFWFIVFLINCLGVYLNYNRSFTREEKIKLKRLKKMKAELDSAFMQKGDNKWTK